MSGRSPSSGPWRRKGRVPLGAFIPGRPGVKDRIIGHDAVRAFGEPPLVDDAAELLAAAPLHAIAFSFTSSSYVRGASDLTISR